MERNEAEKVVRETIEYANREISMVRKDYRKGIAISIAALLLIGLAVLLWPRSFSRYAQDNWKLLVRTEENTHRASIEIKEYPEITEAQQKAIRERLLQCRYRLRLTALFSDTVEHHGGDIYGTHLSLYFYDDAGRISGFSIAPYEEMLGNGRVYRLKQSRQLIADILEILEQE